MTYLLSIGICVVGCRSEQDTGWILLDTPAGPESETPNMHEGADGTIYLSWMEWTPDTTAVFYFSQWEGGHWTPAREIARGRDWFVNWADYPSLTAFAESGYLSAHWLQKSAAGKYEYNIVLSISPDGGQTWRKPFVLHQDSIPAEHGFVSAVRDGDYLFYAWLDGRNTAGHGHGHAHQGAMTLRGCWLDRDGNKSGEQELDSMICDCCQTAVVKTAEGLVVSYRDRSEEEIRDISHVTWDGKTWSAPQTIHPDHWKIAGCPVNGPSMSHQGNQVHRGWYGIKDSLPHVSLITSPDGGKSWNHPVALDTRMPIGRVNVASDPHHVFVSWIGKDDQGETWVNVGTIVADKNEPMISAVTKIDGSRRSGVPIMISSDDGLFLAYTHVENEGTQVRVMRKE